MNNEFSPDVTDRPPTRPDDLLVAAPPHGENADDSRLKRRVSWPSLAALTFSGMVGSGWLFASYYAAQMAGPLALVSWILAGAATALVGITFIELAVTRPIAGGNVRWPAVISGPFMGVMIGWVVFLQVAIGTPSEAAGLLQYATRWWPELVDGAKLSGLGLGIATLVLVLFTALNWFGVHLMARVNNLVTVFKVVVPFLTVALLLATGFDSSNAAAGGGWAPYGAGAMLTAITGAGLIYSFGGIQTSAAMAGEARNPRRDVPLGTFVGFGAAFLLYLLLQVSFLGAVPNGMLAEVGWHGLNFNSPFAQLATLLNLAWVSQLLMLDAVVSPGGALFMGIGVNARYTYGLGQNRTLPRWVARVHGLSGIPRNALLVNLAISVLFLFLFQSWQGLVSALGMFFAVGYAVIAVAAGVNHRDPRLASKRWARGMRWVAPAAFVFSGLIMYWAGWPEVSMALLLFLLAIPLYIFLVLRDRARHPVSSLKGGVWFLAFMVTIGVLSALGSFKGLGIIGSPIDSIVVGAVSLAFYGWGYRQSAKWMLSSAAEQKVAASAA